MIKWSERPSEVKFLLNPAFCARIIYATLLEYEKHTGNPIPFPLVYLILPLVLHKKTREKINSKTAFTNWVQTNAQLIIGFEKRAKDLVPITNEAIELLFQTQKICMSSRGTVEINSFAKKLSKRNFVDEEVKECITKAEHVARWFAKTGKTETVYISLGVKP